MLPSHYVKPRILLLEEDTEQEHKICTEAGDGCLKFMSFCEGGGGGFLLCLVLSGKLDNYGPKQLFLVPGLVRIPNDEADESDKNM